MEELKRQEGEELEFRQYIHHTDGSITHGGAQARVWKQELDLLHAEFGEGDEQIWVLDHLPITPQQKLDLVQMLRNEEEKN